MPQIECDVQLLSASSPPVPVTFHLQMNEKVDDNLTGTSMILRY